jgi:hypothetical protein
MLDLDFNIVEFDLVELKVDMHQVCRNNWRIN